MLKECMAKFKINEFTYHLHMQNCFMQNDNREVYNAFYLEIEPDYYLFNVSRERAIGDCKVGS